MVFCYVSLLDLHKSFGFDTTNSGANDQLTNEHIWK